MTGAVWFWIVVLAAAILFVVGWGILEVVRGRRRL